MADLDFTRGFQMLAGRSVIDKHPGDELDYSLGFANRIPPEDTIATYDIPVEVGVSVVRSAIDSTGKYLDLWVNGGKIGSPAYIKVNVTTAGVGSHPRTIEWTLHFAMKPA